MSSMYNVQRYILKMYRIISFGSQNTSLRQKIPYRITNDDDDEEE
jgi:hypothetical protein